MDAVRRAPSPSELVERARAEDRAAEEELVRRFLPAIRAFASRRLRTRDAVDEFTQEAVLVVVQSLRAGTIEHGERFGGFVLGVCRNLARQRVRHEERRALLFELYGETSLGVMPPELHEVNLRAIHLEDCLSQMSERTREVLWLGYGESLDHGEIAKRMKISPENARVLRHRSLVALKNCLSKPASYEVA